MQTVNVSELRQNLRDYMRRVGAGERFIVMFHNTAIAMLLPPAEIGPPKPRVRRSDDPRYWPDGDRP